MKSYTQHIDGLLVKQLTGEATANEKLLVEQWLSEDDDNRRYFDHFKLIWEQSADLAANTDVDEQAAWERFQTRVQQKDFPPAKTKVRPLNSPLMRAAVITGLIVGIAWITWYLFNNNPGNVLSMATIQATGSVKTDTLPDGSTVTLNKHSQVSYPEIFTGKKRVLQLNGEAFFKVTHNKEKPFEVHTNSVTITVIGTSFNVRSRGDTTEIIVETGIVRVATEQQTVTLQAGQKAIVGVSKAILQKQSNTDQLYNYYRSKKFVCEGTPLWKLAEKLNEAYDVHIVLESDRIRNLPLSATFIDEPLDNILNIISTTFEISVIKEKEQIILR